MLNNNNNIGLLYWSPASNISSRKSRNWDLTFSTCNLVLSCLSIILVSLNLRTLICSMALSHLLCSSRTGPSSPFSTTIVQQPLFLPCLSVSCSVPRLSTWSNATCQLCRRFCIVTCRPRGSSSQTALRRIRRYVVHAGRLGYCDNVFSCSHCHGLEHFQGAFLLLPVKHWVFGVAVVAAGATITLLTPWGWGRRGPVPGLCFCYQRLLVIAQQKT